MNRATVAPTIVKRSEPVLASSSYRLNITAKIVHTMMAKRNFPNLKGNPSGPKIHTAMESITQSIKMACFLMSCKESTAYPSGSSNCAVTKS